MRFYKGLVLGFCVFLIFLSGAYLFYSLYVIEEVIVLSADVYISKDKVGFNLDPDRVHFGIVRKGTSSSLRFVDINNNRPYPVEVIIKGDGEIRQWLYTYLKDNPETTGPIYSLGPEESQVIVFGLIPDEEAEIGKKYTGEIKLIIKKAGYW